METRFTLEQLQDPTLRTANDILRKCVHCGFCTATCPTYTLLGDEADSPRGRIYAIKDMLETGKAPSTDMVTHIDRCLSCLSCMTTCPSGVHYMHLIDITRARIEQTYRRPFADRFLRGLLARLVPNPALFRLSLIGARLGAPFAAILPKRLAAMVRLRPKTIHGPSDVDRAQTFPAEHLPADGARARRVALMTGCAQKVLRPTINEATVRLLTRHGFEVVVADGAGCCGALTHHMGREDEALESARANVAAWERVAADGGLDAIVINASGCGTTVKDYGNMLKDDPDWADRAAKIAGLARDITEVMSGVPLRPAHQGAKPVVAYHSACSMQHGQKLKTEPQALLKAAGFEVREPWDSHLCCGSAGTYNMLQPDLADRLGRNKAGHLDALAASVVATGNIGCLAQLEKKAMTPVVHTVELLDWATGGPAPDELSA